MKLSIDPGTDATGICVWENGVPIRLITARTATKSRGNERIIYEHKRMYMQRLLRDVLDALVEEFGGIEEVAIEDFIKYTHRRKFQNIQKLYKTVGTIEGLLLERYNIEPKRVCKGNVPKEQAMFLARAYGLDKAKGSSLDSRDALHIGCLAGFAKR